MTLSHSEVKVHAGDRWEFRGRLQNVNGTPMDITNRTVEWKLLDRQQHLVNVTTTVTKLDNVGGLINILVTGAASATIAPGRYTDYCRVDGEMIMWTGQIVVMASPFMSLAA
jgi:hypothetical protein